MLGWSSNHNLVVLRYVAALFLTGDHELAFVSSLHISKHREGLFGDIRGTMIDTLPSWSIYALMIWATRLKIYWTHDYQLGIMHSLHCSPTKLHWATGLSGFLWQRISPSPLILETIRSRIGCFKPQIHITTALSFISSFLHRSRYKLNYKWKSPNLRTELEDPSKSIDEDHLFLRLGTKLPKARIHTRMFNFKGCSP